MAAATQLVCTQAPTSYQSDVALSPVLVFEARDGSNVKDATYTGAVSLAVNTGTGSILTDTATGASLATRTLTVNAVAGVVTFNGAQLNGYAATTLIATAAGLASATTGAIAATGTRDGTAELPRVSVTTTYPSPIGSTYTVGPGKSYATIQAAVNAAAAAVTTGHAEIIIDPGDYNEIVTLKARPAANTGWIVLRPASLPTASGTRVHPSDFASGQVRITGTNRTGQVITEWVAGSPDQAAHHYRLAGIEVTSAITAPSDIFALIYLGGSGVGNGDYTSIARVPHHILVDRCYIHGNGSVESNKGVYCNAATAAVIDCYVAEIHQQTTTGADTNAFLAINTPGPLLVQNNYLEAAGENVMIGGGDPAVTDNGRFSVADITITKNHIAKPAGWKGVWGVKNIVEIKNGHRVLLEGNVLENNWDNNSQHGGAFVFKGTNQDNTAPWSSSDDITCRYNFVRQVGQIVALCGNVDATSSAGTHRIEFHDNVAVGMNTATFNGAMACVQAALDSGSDVRANHNTVMAVPGSTKGLYLASATGNPFVRFRFDDNIVTADDDAGGGLSYGVFGDSYGGQSGAINHYITGGGGTFLNDTLVGTRGYTGTAFAPTATVVSGDSTVGFTDPSVLSVANVAALSPDAILAGLVPLSAPAASAGSDRAYIGADIATVRSKTAGAWSAGELTGSSGGTATQLLLSTEPAGAVSGQPLTQQPVVAIADAGGSTVTSDTSTVTAEWISLTGDATPSGTLTKAASAGVATFTNLALSWTVASSGYWQFTDGSLTVAQSSTFNLGVTGAVAPTKCMIFRVFGRR